MDALTFILVALAVYRVSHMFASETGPFGACEKWRNWIFKRLWVDGKQTKEQPHYWMIEGVGCPLCISFWFSLVAFWFGWGIVGWLGMAGAILVVHKAVSK